MMLAAIAPQAGSRHTHTLRTGCSLVATCNGGTGTATNLLTLPGSKMYLSDTVGQHVAFIGYSQKNGAGAVGGSQGAACMSQGHICMCTSQHTEPSMLVCLQPTAAGSCAHTCSHGGSHMKPHAAPASITLSSTGLRGGAGHQATNKQLAIRQPTASQSSTLVAF